MLRNDLARTLVRVQQKRDKDGPGAKLQRASVLTWSAEAGYVIVIGGAQFSDVPLLASAGTLAPGDVVAVLRYKSSLLILGVITYPDGS